MAERNAEHIRTIETTALKADIDDNNKRHQEIMFGQTIGGFTIALAFAFAIYALSRGYSGVATTVCAVTIGGIVAAFFGGKYPSRKQPQDNQATNHDQSPAE
jgi:hypothetical protein